MSAFRKTKKLKEAIAILVCDEGFSDTSDRAWYLALESGKVAVADVYRALAAYGMKWDALHGYWYRRARRMNFVRSMFAVVRRIDSHCLEPLDCGE